MEPENLKTKAQANQHTKDSTVETRVLMMCNEDFCGSCLGKPVRWKAEKESGLNGGTKEGQD